MASMARECAKRSKVEDRISRLPGDILVCIISSLPLKEAARTSVLSKYWSGLWLFSAKLDFDAFLVLKRLHTNGKGLRRERRKYVDWVDNVVRSHKAAAIDEFRIQFELDSSFQNHIDEWLSYAFSRKVQVLDLHLSFYISYYNVAMYGPYCFPTRLLLEQNSKFLIRSLSLVGVQVTRKDVDVFLCKFLFLERLKLCASKVLLSVEICGSSLALKHLEIYGCVNLKSIVVRDSCLVSLEISKVNDLVVENVPKLVNIGIAGTLVRDFKPQLSACLSRLLVFSFQVSCYDYHQVKVIDLPEMTELKQLNLSFMAGGSQSLMALTSLIRASPKLEKLVFKVEWIVFERSERECEKSPRHPLQHLKVVEFHGYCGCSAEDELVMYILENAVALEKLTVFIDQEKYYNPWISMKSTRKHAKKLKRRRPSSLVQIVIV